MPIRCLQALVNGCPQLERINAGWYSPESDDDDDDDDDHSADGAEDNSDDDDHHSSNNGAEDNLDEDDNDSNDGAEDNSDEDDNTSNDGAKDSSNDDATRSDERVGLASALDLVPNLKELDIDFAYEGYRELVAELAGRTTVQITLDPDKIYSEFLLNSDMCGFPWMQSRPFLAALPRMIKMPVSGLSIGFTKTQQEKIAMFAEPSFAFMRTALEMVVLGGNDEYVTRILRFRKSAAAWLSKFTHGGQYEKLEQLCITGNKYSTVRSEHYAAFWGAMKAGTLPPPLVNLKNGKFLNRFRSLSEVSARSLGYMFK
ncbi:hypothetical protein HK102_013584 [Quaeritorhiza haematococci]|nr:hypothetical protein HK102_013584 [Quaeritorhiza haematococci]